MLEGKVRDDFVILAYTMPPDMPSQPSGRERREFYRITVLLPICIQLETDEAEGEFTEKSVNLSGGGIGVTVTESYTPGEVLSLTLLPPRASSLQIFYRGVAP